MCIRDSLSPLRSSGSPGARNQSPSSEGSALLTVAQRGRDGAREPQDACRRWGLEPDRHLDLQGAARALAGLVGELRA
eukprot:12103237-Alexandrium_andersonii.AAC.1